MQEVHSMKGASMCSKAPHHGATATALMPSLALNHGREELGGGLSTMLGQGQQL